MFVIARHRCFLGTLAHNVLCREFFSLSTYWTGHNFGWPRSLCQMAKSTITSPVPINHMVLGSGRNPHHHPVPVVTARSHTEGRNTWLDAADQEGRKTIPFIRKNGPIDENTP